MAKHVEPDKILMKIPSLRAIKSFVAAAKYQSFTSAAESLCVTQAAISRQIRELEDALGVKLFNRVGRSIELTEAGNIFYDAAYLSFVNIAQVAQRIENQNVQRKEVTLCCSPAFSTCWLSLHLPKFMSLHPDINVNIITTNSILSLEPDAHPDFFISKSSTSLSGYISKPLFHDIIYPVCSPEYLKSHPDIQTAESLDESMLLNLSPFGRAQLAEHVDWEVWFAEVQQTFQIKNGYSFTSNDYNLLINMATQGHGVCLGWHHLVYKLIEEGKLVKIGDLEARYKEKCHYLAYSEEKSTEPALIAFGDWILSELAFGYLPPSV